MLVWPGVKLERAFCSERHIMTEPENGDKFLIVSSSPHLSEPATSRRIMAEVLIGCAPAALFAVFFFKILAIKVLVTCIVTAVLTEYIFNAVRKKRQTAFDGSAIVAATILGLSLPPAIPFWAAMIGMVVSIAVAKMLFGGLGCNIFNPAMVGRAFLMACFGTMMTFWVMPQNVDYKGIKVDEAGNSVVAVSQATPLKQAKQPIKDSAKPLEELAKEDRATAVEANSELSNAFWGNIGGSLGETSALAWLIGGLFLLLRGTITWHTPVGVLGAAAAVSAIAWGIDSDVYASPLLHLCSGGLMMCAFFIATDPVTCPLTKKGRLIFGIGVGTLTMLIRLIGGYPEGIMYAILLMNSVTPLIDSWTVPKPYGDIPKP